MMPLFGDEPEERPSSRRREPEEKTKKRIIFSDEPEERLRLRRREQLTKEPLMPRAKPGGMRLFGEEPEEAFNRSRTPSAGSKAKPSPGTSAVLFGDEEEEAPSAAGMKIESESDDDDDEGVVTQPATLHLNWSGLKMFEQVSFLKRAAEKSKPAEKKRAYDNSKRLEKVLAKPHRSYQSQALNPERLINLFNKSDCKWFLAVAIFNFSKSLKFCLRKKLL